MSTKFTRHLMSALACTAGTAGAVWGQGYELRLQPALSIYGIPESYLFDVNESGRACGLMTYTTALPGGSYSTTYKGYLWTPAGGPEVVTDLPSIYGLNNAGDYVTGGLVRYAAGGSASIPVLPGLVSIDAAEINDAGLVTGTSSARYHSGCVYKKAFLWTPQSGVVDLSVYVPGARLGADVNNAGRIVGTRGPTCDYKAFLFDANTLAYTDLNALLNGGPWHSHAYAISENDLVVGEGFSGSFTSGWLWSQASGFTFLPALKNGDRDRVRPRGVNSRGVVVGSAPTAGTADIRAFMWDAAGGMIDLNDIVTPPPNFILDRALAITDSGYIVGDGHYGPNWDPSVAWVLIPEAPCYADCDTSTGVGALDVFDFLCFQNRYDAGNPYACDCDTSTGAGACDVFDFLCFQNAFAAGCR